MISSNFDETTGVLILKPEGPLEEADFQEVARQVDPYIENRGELTGLIIHAFMPKSFQAGKTWEP